MVYLNKLKCILCIWDGYECFKEKRSLCWPHIVREDVFGASTFISAAIESKLRIVDSSSPTKGTIEVIYDMRENHKNQQPFYYSIFNKIFIWNKTISR